MAHPTLLLYCFLTAAFATAQPSRSTILLDGQTMESVPYASVGSGSFSFFADAEGRFSIESVKGSTLTIERLGYERLSIPIDEIGDTLFLRPVLFSLEPVEIFSEKAALEAGYHRMKSSGSTYGRISQGLGIICDGLPRNAQITKAYAHLQHSRKGHIYRISIFTVTDSGMPDELIYSREYVSPNSSNLLAIPIEKEVVPNKESIALVFDWVDRSNGAMDKPDFANLRMTDENIGSHSFRFVSFTNQWHVLDIQSNQGFDRNYKLGIEYTTTP